MKNLKNISLITVLTLSTRNSTMTIVERGNLQHTAGNAALPAMPTNDTAMAALVGPLLTTYNSFKAVPPLTTSAQVTSKKTAVVTAYNQNAGYIQGIARAEAIAAGDVNVGIQLVNASGYKLKKTKSPSTRVFKVTNAGIGAVEITSKAVATRAGYIRQYGPTTAKNVPPVVIAEDLYSLEVSIYLNNLKSGTMYGFREASILPVTRSTVNTLPISAVKKIATPTIATKSHKVSFSDGAEHYSWCPWQYLGIQ
jgi:hypothetical protein